MAYTIQIKKESLKFSGSHFTIFSSKKAERLHGHNYYLTCELTTDTTDPELGMAFDFNLVKPLLKSICEELDEFVLIPKNSPHLKLKETSTSVQVGFASKEYVFPKEDVRVLPVTNITSEELARYVSDELIKKLTAQLKIKKVVIGVAETLGQSVFFERTL